VLFYSNSNIQTKFYRLFLGEVELFDIHKKKTGPDSERWIKIRWGENKQQQKAEIRLQSSHMFISGKLA